ncbi:MAG: PVC-type heme-binding CxxCH protein [Salinivenus sp.]
MGLTLCLLAGLLSGCGLLSGAEGGADSSTGASSAVETTDSTDGEATPSGTTAKGDEPNRGGEMNLASRDPQVALDRLRTGEDYEVNLFASEKQFPELANPTQMTWDAQGRLWVSVMPYYPHYLPGNSPNDKILVLEDTNRDGRADSLTVFADSLYLPGGFELGDGGVYVARQPDLMVLRDTDGDGRADTRKRILHGFGTGDSHHSLSAFEWGPGGALYMMEGTFLYSQVETPQGPERLRYGGVWRYHPETEELDVHASYPFANPWGQTFNFWGQNFLFDASGGANYFALPITGKVDYPRKHVPMRVFTEWVRPTSGGEIIRSPHFPDSLQGNLLINNVIGFQGVKQHRMVEEGSGYNSEEVDPLLYSVDRNFRPVDLQFGPDGALYVVDWWNPLIGHMQYSLRDPRRDSTHGRIWRVTQKDRALLKDPTIKGRSATDLLDMLTKYTDRSRVLYRIRRELRSRSQDEVRAALQTFTSELDASSALYEHHLLEALWAYQSQGLVEEDLLRQLLRADRYQVRAAATRVLRFWRDEVEGILPLFEQQVNDPHPRVRLEAVVALSYVESAAAAEVALQALDYPVDYYLDYGLRETLKSLEGAWKPALAEGDLEASSRGVRYAIEQLETAELAEMMDDTPLPAVYRELLGRGDVAPDVRTEALSALAQVRGASDTETLLYVLGALGDGSDGLDALSERLLARGADTLARHRSRLQTLAVAGKSSVARQTGFAALITAEGESASAWELASKSRRGLYDFLNAVPRTDSTARVAVYDRVRSVVNTLPQGLDDRAIRADVVEIVGRTDAARRTPPTTALLDTSGAEVAAGLSFENARSGAWNAAWPAGTAASHLRVDVPKTAYPERSLDAYGVRVLDDGQLVFQTTPDRPHYASNNLSYGTVTKGPMSNRFKPKLRGSAAIPTGDTLAVGGDASPETLRRAAIRALASIPAQYASTFRLLKEQVAESQFLYEAVAGINQVPSSQWPEPALDGFGRELLEAAQKVPIEERSNPEFQEVVQLGLTLASRLPGDRRESLRSGLNDLIRIVTIEAVPREMKYDKTEFTVSAGKPIVIVFKNPDAVDHNFVIVEPGAMKAVGKMGDAMAGDPEAYEKDFVPDTDQVLWATDLIGTGEQDQLSFIAPEEPGAYPYECTFPGHWRTMNGTMRVTSTPAASR